MYALFLLYRFTYGIWRQVIHNSNLVKPAVWFMSSNGSVLIQNCSCKWHECQIKNEPAIKKKKKTKPPVSNKFWTLIQQSSGGSIKTRLHSSKSEADWEFFPANASHLDKLHLLQKQLASVWHIVGFWWRLDLVDLFFLAAGSTSLTQLEIQIISWASGDVITYCSLGASLTFSLQIFLLLFAFNPAVFYCQHSCVNS